MVLAEIIQALIEGMLNLPVLRRHPSERGRVDAEAREIAAEAGSRRTHWGSRRLGD